MNEQLYYVNILDESKLTQGSNKTSHFMIKHDKIVRLSTYTAVVIFSKTLCLNFYASIYYFNWQTVLFVLTIIF